MKATSAHVPSITGRRLRAPDRVRARDWAVAFALCMGIASLALMVMLTWL